MRGSLNDAQINRIKASMIDNFTDFISIANKNREIIYFNPAAYKMMGYGPDERPDITSTAQLHAEGFDAFAASVIQPSVFKNGFWTGISAIRHKDGHTLVVEMTVFPIYGEDGEEYGTVAVIRDVNELTKANERLQKSSELFQKVLDSAKIGVVLINMETNTIEMVNLATEEMLMMSRDEIVGKKCYDILCHSSLALCPHVNEKDKKVLLAERFLKRKDGSAIPIIKTGTWITIDNTEYLVDTFVDISIQKELENNLSAAKIVAESASRAKSEFLSRMSHEMRTPLNAIIGMTKIAEKTSDLAKLKKSIETIQLSSGHLLNLINDVLDVSKIEEGKLELSLDDFSLTVMMEKIKALIQPKVAEKHIRFMVDEDENLPAYVNGDSLRLSQVLLNFLSNAVKFTPEGKEIILSVKVKAIQNNTVSLYFAVKDEGIGIAEENLARLFNPFMQADGSITRKYGGTGLGLNISKRLVNLMGSDIEVDSIPDEGSTFAFTIDLPIAAGAAMDTYQAPEDMTDIFKGMHVLIVDDVDLNRLITMELLAETGIVFAEAANGREAVEMATRALYDIILMDIQMPVMDGYEATYQIRQAAVPYSNTPIIAMSANVFKEDVELSLAKGMDAHVGKPIDAEKLVAVINELLVKRPDVIDAVPKMVFKRNIVQTQAEKNYFNFKLALREQGDDPVALAVLCRQFIETDQIKKLQEAVEAQNYPNARDIIEALVAKAHNMAMLSLGSYAGNVGETLESGNYAYATMYLSDLIKCYHATSAVIAGLLLDT